MYSQSILHLECLSDSVIVWRIKNLLFFLDYKCTCALEVVYSLISLSQLSRLLEDGLTKDSGSFSFNIYLPSGEQTSDIIASEQ